MKYDVIIIGAGPAGLFAATMLGKQNKRVLLLEKNNRAGKKLLLSGSGQCNITHGGDMADYADHYGDNYKSIKTALNHFTNKDLIRFFETRGLKMEVESNGKVFPKSRLANDVLGVLLKQASQYGTYIHYQEPVREINLENKIYHVTTDKKTYKANFVIIATGGKSYPKTGSTGDGYLLGDHLGHPIIKPKPALAPIEIKAFPFQELAGLSFENLAISIWRNKKKEKDCTGDILFTHKGLSGPGILNNSRWMEEGDVLRVNFMKGYNKAVLDQKLIRDLDANGKDMIKTILRTYELPRRFVDLLLTHIGIREETQCAKINKNTRSLLVNSLIAFPFTISKIGSFSISMATAGGIDMKKVNPTSMESRICKNLYFIGEVLDIDGDTGGYNIQAAISSATLCANKISQKEAK